jgi:hypothetical protein
MDLGNLQRFLHLTSAQRGLYLEAVLLLAIMRGILRLVRFWTLWKWLEHIGIAQTDQRRCQSEVSTACIARVLRCASRYVPGTTCLMQALAGAVMLRRRGHAASLCIGVTKEGGDFGAHAWVECEGVAVVGSRGAFTTLLVLPGAQS